MKPMTTTALPSYHERKAGHCVTSFLHVVSGPNNSFALKLVMLVNKNLRGARSTRHRVPEGPLSFKWLLQSLCNSKDILTNPDNPRKHCACLEGIQAAS